MYQPLADALRPQELSDVCGQQHILGENGLLRRIIESGSVPNMIFYGPSGTGKTTVANLIAKKTQRKLCKLNATTASSADIKEIYAQLDTFLAPNGVLLYLDEIQYFNKKQQQTLLEYIENGKITLIASTTENPYFYVYNAILSRSTVFEFKPVEKDEAQRAVSRALNYLEARDSVTILPEPGVKEHIAQSCGGDIRKALNAVEFLYTATRPENGVVRLTMADAKQVSQRSAMRYDKSGNGFSKILKTAAANAETKGRCTVFGYYVQDPERFGIVEFDQNGKVLSVEEKPEHPKSNYAITGLYFYNKEVVQMAKQVKPSARGELEITTLNDMYLKKDELDVQLLGRGFAWLDTGTMESLVDAADFVRMVEKRQGIKISAPEEIAFKYGWIDRETLLESASRYGKSPYGQHLKNVADGKLRY